MNDFSWKDLGEGISSVVESSLGLPSPEEVAKQQAERSEQKPESIEGKVFKAYFMILRFSSSIILME